jgi:uncharacterized protein
MSKKSAVAPKDLTVEEKLRALMDLQIVDSRIDKIKTIRGELPLEVEDLEAEIEGMETRIKRKKSEITQLEAEINGKKNLMREAATLITKYEAQQLNVRNNREFDSLSKEIEYQSLEIQLAEKRIKEFRARIDLFEQEIEGYVTRLEERKADLSHKKGELDAIIAETQKDEEKLQNFSTTFSGHIEDRYLTAYKRIRSNSFNGMAVVPIERNACGGCFNMIPPQRQLDIAQRKKIIVCEHCGRILVDAELHSDEIDKVDDMIK